ncbi:MAG: 3-hydroxybutyrate oligomer hydrolase family protein [Desulfobacteraceae bacterium]
MKASSLVIAAAALLVWSTATFAKGGHEIPVRIVPGSLEVVQYDGITDDLLSGGLNSDGLQNASPPGFADPLDPTPTELRRLAIYTNFRAITDMTPAGGYGLFWGPGQAPAFEGATPGLIPGVEYKALMRVEGEAGHVNNVPVAVQIPDNFAPEDPCIFLAPPSGSRGYYGGIAVGEWGLLQGCAVVLPGKATGTGFHLLESDEVYDRDGVLEPAAEIGRNAQFAVRKTSRLKRFIDNHPDRVAVKHAHSQINPERLWGDLALRGIEFAFWALNDHYGRKNCYSDRRANEGKTHGRRKRCRFIPDNTRVIASGTSNAAGTSLRALEKDHKGLIDGLVVIEPNINPDSAGKFAIDFGGEIFEGHGTSLYDNHTLMGIYAPCAALSPSLAGTPLNLDPIGAPAGARAGRCESLQASGLLTADTLEAQADEALGILRDNGYYEEQETLLAAHEWLNLWRSLNPTYANAHGRFAVWNNLCGISFAAAGAMGSPAPLPLESAASLFSTSGGIPPTGGVQLINDEAANGPILENLSMSPATGRQDLNLDGARCFRYLATGDTTLLNDRPGIADIIRYLRVQRGIRETLTTGDLHGTPAIILAGRSDALVFPNFHSRPYFGLNQVVEGDASRLAYIEVTNAQHFDALISTLWLDPQTGAVQFVPLHYYLFQALDWMNDYLKGKRSTLPPSQVVRAQPRGLKPYELSDAGSSLLPDIQDNPDTGDRITFDSAVLKIPK